MGRIFKKRHQEHLKQQTEYEKQRSQSLFQEEQQMIKQIEEESQYDFFKRKQQIELNKDFKKQREKNLHTIPQDIGKGGINELIFWSQNAQTPQQIQELIQKFNEIPQHQIILSTNNNGAPSYTTKNKIEDELQLSQFIANVSATVYLAQTYPTLMQYSLFGYKYSITNEDYWKKIQEKMLRKQPQTPQDFNNFIDIVFIIGNTLNKCQLIYPAVEKQSSTRTITTEQSVKLLIAFFKSQKGNKEFIVKLIVSLEENIEDFNEEIIESILPIFKQSKNIPKSFDEKLQAKILKLLKQEKSSPQSSLSSPSQLQQVKNQTLPHKQNIPQELSLTTICTICEYYGYEKGSQQLFQSLQTATRLLIQQSKQKTKHAPLPAHIMQKIINGILTSYKFSPQFVKQLILPQLKKKDFRILYRLKPTTLSTLSKCLYIYEMQEQSSYEMIENTIQLLIMKYFENLNNFTNDELVTVLKDYTVTRRGSREFYQFLEKLVKEKMAEIHTERYILEALATIYEESNLCSPQTLEMLRGMISL